MPLTSASENICHFQTTCGKKESKMELSLAQHACVPWAPLEILWSPACGRRAPQGREGSAPPHPPSSLHRELWEAVTGLSRMLP